MLISSAEIQILSPNEMSKSKGRKIPFPEAMSDKRARLKLAVDYE